MPNFSRLVYVSQAVRPFAGAELRLFADGDRRRNERVGVTGVLVAGGGQFLQALEGELEDVASRFDALRHDPRHGKVQRLLFEFAPERLFTAWWMGLVDLDSAGAAERGRLVELVRLARALPAAGGDSIGPDVLTFLRECKAHLLRVDAMTSRRVAG